MQSPCLRPTLQGSLFHGFCWFPGWVGNFIFYRHKPNQTNPSWGHEPSQPCRHYRARSSPFRPAGGEGRAERASHRGSLRASWAPRGARTASEGVLCALQGPRLRSSRDPSCCNVSGVMVSPLCLAPARSRSSRSFLCWLLQRVRSWLLPH